MDQPAAAPFEQIQQRLSALEQQVEALKVGDKAPSPPDDLPGPRRLTLADGMILVAATAFGLALMRGFGDWSSYPGVLFKSDSGWLEPVASLVALGVPLVASWTPAVVLLRLTSPRSGPGKGPTLHDRGTLTAASASLAMLLGSLSIGLACVFQGNFDQSDYLAITILLSPLMGAGGVLGAWLTLRLSGLWRPPIDWIDRLGLALGWFWILAPPFAFWILLR